MQAGWIDLQCPRLFFQIDTDTEILMIVIGKFILIFYINNLIKLNCFLILEKYNLYKLIRI